MKFQLNEDAKSIIKSTKDGCLDLSDYDEKYIISELLKNINQGTDPVRKRNTIEVENEVAYQVFPDGTCISSYSHMDIDYFILEALNRNRDKSAQFDLDAYSWDTGYSAIGYSLLYNFNTFLLRWWKAPYYEVSLFLPYKPLTNIQYTMLETYLYKVYDKYSKDAVIDIGTASDAEIKYSFKDYFPDDIIKKIKHFYSSGILYESATKFSSTAMLNEWFETNAKMTKDGCIDLSAYTATEIITKLLKIGKALTPDPPKQVAKLQVVNELAQQVFPDGTCIVAHSHMAIDDYILDYILRKPVDSPDFEDDVDEIITDVYPLYGYSLCYNFNTVLVRVWLAPYNNISITLPQKNLTNIQYELLEELLNTLYNKYGKNFQVDLGDLFTADKRYSFNDYFPEDIIKKIKRFYSSGILYESASKSSITDQYDSYLDQHISYVQNGYNWIKENLSEILDKVEDRVALDKQIKNHDHSKWQDDEYYAYADYFYGKQTKEVKDAFDAAWNLHQKRNAHHWQYWVLINDEDGTKVLDIPYNYIIEMIMDWWAFSWKEDNLKEIFDWYKNNKSKMMLSKNTKSIVEDILKKLEVAIDQYELDK